MGDDRSMKFGVGDCHFHVPVQALDRLAVAGIPNDARTEWGKDLHFIHHLSHTGSTLLSRAIGEIEGTLVLREPYLLRWIAKATALSSSKDVSQAYLKFMLPCQRSRCSWCAWTSSWKTQRKFCGTSHPFSACPWTLRKQTR